MNSLLQKNSSGLNTVMHFAKPKNSVQPKLSVNTPGDIYEQEADAMADQVMRMSSNETVKPVTGLIGKSLQRKCAHCEEDEKKRKPVMRKAEAGNIGMPVSSSFASTLNASKSGGTPLPEGTRNFMENAFSADFSRVKIHTGSQASEMSKGIKAKAFTYGNDIYFKEGQYQPSSEKGRHLLAHELVHTMQQDGTVEQRVQKLSDPDCSSNTSLPISGSCPGGDRECYYNTCNSETFRPSSSSAITINASVEYCEDPGNTGPEDFSVQVYKCHWYGDTRIGSKRMGGNIPDSLRFSIASVTAGDDYYIKIYSRSHLGLRASYSVSQ